MEDVIQISVSNWHLFLQEVAHEMDVFVPVENGIHIEYGKFENTDRPIRYNKPAPVTPLKFFLLPVKENVVVEKFRQKRKIVVGIPSCDLKALDLLDEIYLDEKYPDPVYKWHRENTILIGSECYEFREHCHCIAYGIERYPITNDDVTLVSLDGELILTVKTSKGEAFISRLRKKYPVKVPARELLAEAESRRSSTRERLMNKNQYLPDYATIGKLINQSGEEIWARHSQPCVSCGACATICPTCTCFLLIDRPGFEKVRQLDSCQFPGFERIAAGEDPLRKKSTRFRNRYLCKYVWKHERFNAQACTGCGRCIECCLGNINKNKIFTEMSESS